MPHVIVKLWPGNTTAQKQALSDAIVRDIAETLGLGAESVSVCFEEVTSTDWLNEVYSPDIERRWHTLTKQPGYGPDDLR